MTDPENGGPARSGSAVGGGAGQAESEAIAGEHSCHVPHITFRADRLAVARHRLGLSQLELARRLGVDQSTVSRLERGAIEHPPWKLVMRACLALDIEPQALIWEFAGPGYYTCHPQALLRARISHHFLYLGHDEKRLPEVLHYILLDCGRMRPTVVGLSLMLFEWRGAPARHFYAYSRQGETGCAERLEPPGLTTPTRRLRHQWQTEQVLVRDGREELGRKDVTAIDVPLAQGMIGVDFSDSEDLEAEDSRRWVLRLAETFQQGIGLVDLRQERVPDNLGALTARLTALERVLTEASTSPRQEAAANS